MAINKNKVMEGAQKLVEKGQLDKAIKEYLKVVQEDPKDVRVWLKVGDLYAKKGAKSEATETYLKVAQFYGEQGFYLKAVAVYKQILKLEPRLIDVNLKLAEVYRQLGLLSDAMQQYELVAAHYHREGKTREALATIRDLVELDPENVATRIKLAELYSKEGMASEAIAEFGRAADFLRSHNRLDDFIKVAERLVWHQPDNHGVNRELAQLYLKRSDPRRALQKLQACFKADPRDIDTLSLLATAFQALDQKPKTVSVWKELARIHQENGQGAQAQDVYRRILTLEPNDADALAALGRQAPRAHGTGGMPAVGAPAAAGSVAAPAIAAAGSPSGFARVATPIAPEPTPAPRAAGRRAGQSGEVARLVESAPVIASRDRDTGGAASLRRPTGSFPVVDPSFLDAPAGGPPPPAPPMPAPRGSQAVRGRFDLEEEPSQPTSRREARDVEVELEMDDFGGGEEVLGAGADPAEAHADEIAKILTETDVYTKYGLHQKAIDHLKKVFDIDSRNVEAREKLKDVLIALGRNDEAASELLRLAEYTGAANPEQATAYLKELFALAPDDDRGIALARRLRLDVLPYSPESPPEPIIEAEFELEAPSDAEIEVEAGEAATGELSLPDSGTGEVSIAEAAPEELDAEVELSVGTADVGSDLALEAEVEAEVGVDFDALGLDDAPPAARLEPPEVAASVAGAEPAASLDFELDDLQAPAVAAPDSTNVVSDDQVAAELDAYEEPAQALSFDGGATRFDPGYAESRSEARRAGFDVSEPEVTGAGSFDAPELELPAADWPGSVAPPATIPPGEVPPDLSMPADFAAGDDQLGLGAAGSAPAVAADEPYGFDTHGGGPATGDMSLDGIDALDPGGGGAAAPSDGAYGDDGLSAGLEAELEEADFFVQQALYAEAREILIGLQARYPQNRLVQAKLQDVDAMEAAASSDGETATSVGESEDLPLEPSAPPAAAAPAPAKRPTVIAKPLGEADADTHFDLGLAYKEMGLHDEAIREFLLVRETPGRAVQCHLMIGLCNLERGKLSEAVTEFKNGLYVEGISDREALSLYFELGSAYQSLADAREALYYFEKVAKRDLRFRDVGTRIEQVKAQIAAAGAPRSVDATLDSTGDDFR